jgi:hypothetical protein
MALAMLLGIERVIDPPVRRRVTAQDIGSILKYFTPVKYYAAGEV